MEKCIRVTLIFNLGSGLQITPMEVIGIVRKLLDGSPTSSTQPLRRASSTTSPYSPIALHNEPCKSLQAYSAVQKEPYNV